MCYKMSKQECLNCGGTLHPVQYADTSVNIITDKYECITCGMQYAYQENSSRSLSTDKVLYCDMCDKNFAQAGSLKRHMSVHTGERPFCCDTCQKSFKTKAALKRHNVIHTGECPFECSTCKRRFNQISNLRKHLLIHSNNCPFYCTYCGKGFNQLSNLKKHLVVHEQHGDGSLRSKKRPDHAIKVKPKGKRPVVTFVKPADS